MIEMINRSALAAVAGLLLAIANQSMVVVVDATSTLCSKDKNK